MIQFYGSVIDGKFKLDSEDSQKMMKYNTTLKNGRYYLTINKESASRSMNQHRYIWGVMVKYVVEHTGEDNESVYYGLKEEYARQTGRIHELEGLNGEKMPMYDLISLSNAKPSDMDKVSEFISWGRNFIYNFFGIDLPEPEK